MSFDTGSVHSVQTFTLNKQQVDTLGFVMSGFAHGIDTDYDFLPKMVLNS